jgi:hypothetical protein
LERVREQEIKNLILMKKTHKHTLEHTASVLMFGPNEAEKHEVTIFEL